jgi:hypothetical protein
MLHKISFLLVILSILLFSSVAYGQPGTVEECLDNTAITISGNTITSVTPAGEDGCHDMVAISVFSTLEILYEDASMICLDAYYLLSRTLEFQISGTVYVSKTWYASDYPNWTTDTQTAYDQMATDGETWMNQDPTGELYNWFNTPCGGAGFDSTGARGPIGFADPIAFQNMQTFKSEVFAERAKPRASKVSKKSDKGKDPAGVAKKATTTALMTTSSDLEYHFFSIDQMDGKNLGIRGGISRTTDDEMMSYGGRFIFMRTAFDDADDATTNNTVSLFGTKILSATETMERSVGANFNYLLLDQDVYEKNGMGFGVYGLNKWYMGEKFAVAGAMYQYIKVDKMTTMYQNFAGSYGFPIGEKMALNLDGLLMWNIYQAYDGEKIDVDENMLLNLGAVMSIYMSETFGLNAGVKKTLLIEDYSSFEITLGSSYRF